MTVRPWPIGWLPLALCLALASGSGRAAEMKDFDEVLWSGDPQRLAEMLKAQGSIMPVHPGSGDTLLHRANLAIVTRNQPAMLAQLLGIGLDVNARNGRQLTPLHLAASSTCGDCVKLLLAAGADLSARRRDGARPIHHAGPETLDALLAAGASLDVRDLVGRRPLHTSSARDRRLLAPGVNVRDDLGMTALHYAALRGDHERIDWLLAQGADPSLESKVTFSLREHFGAGEFEPEQSFAPGTRAFDIARTQDDRSKWSTSRFTPTRERLDKVTPRRGVFSR